MDFKVLATADVHFERLEEAMLPELTTWICDAIKKESPDIFVIAGDTVDSRSLRAETKEYRNLVTFLQQIDRCCETARTQFIILRGTPSHDGAVVENICKTVPQNIMYVDTLSVKTLRGKRILFIPELYYPKLDQFQHDLDKICQEPADLAFFHGMMDFAIPQVSQIDSQFSQSRCIVMDNMALRKRVKTGAFGGHVHSFFSQNDIVYLGRFINERGHVPEEATGLRLITLPSSGGYQISSILNPYVIPLEKVHLDFLNSTLDEILHQCEPRRTLLFETLFICHVGTENSREMFQQWKQLLRPPYYRQKKEKTSSRDSAGVQYVYNHEVDICDLLRKIYHTKTGKSLSENTIKLLEGDKDG